MSAKAPLIAAALALSALVATAALGQDDANSNADSNAALTQQFQRMHGMAETFQASHDPAERQALMLQHMQLMQQTMQQSGMMMGGGMMMGQGAGMPHGGPAGTAGPGAANMPHGDAETMAQMQAQITTMRQMMGELMNQQNMMLQMQQDDDGDDQ